MIFPHTQRHLCATALVVAITVGASAFSLVGRAHQGGIQTGFYGGSVTRAGRYLLELCIQQREIRLFVGEYLHNGAPVDTREAVGYVDLWSSEGRRRVPLQPTGKSMLAGSLDQAEMSDRAVVEVRLPGQAVERGHFRSLHQAMNCHSSP